MARIVPSILLAALATAFLVESAHARDKTLIDSNALTQIVEGSPTLAPFQHVRFCLRYPADCKLKSTDNERIELVAETFELLKRVNHSVNASIAPMSKGYGSNLGDGWTIAPGMGDCNDYAVTKRHELVESGLPAKAMRLATVKTINGVGHLVLVVSTTKGDIVLDNLTEVIRPWQVTGYRWLKIQSATDSKFWHEVQAPAGIALADRRVRLADR